jgi:hypothetical protein
MIGKKCRALGFNMPLGKTVPLGWGVVSHGDNLKVTVTSDKESVKDIDKLMA